MQTTKKIPPKVFELNETDYLYVSYENGWYSVAFYRPYQVGEDGVLKEDANRLRKRFAIRKRSLLDSIRIVFAEGNSIHDADMTEIFIRKSHPRALPGDPGEQHRAETATAANPAP